VRRDLAWLGALAGVLVVVFVTPTIRNSWSFGVGPDVPVYMWWARVGASEGLSLIGERPGIAATIAVAAGTLHLPLVPTIAGLQYALAASVGAAAAGLMRGSAAGGRPAWLLAGLSAGLFAVHLGGGYVANLAFTVPFFVAGAALAKRTQRGTAAAAALLGGAGLAHPQFFLVGVLVLAIAAVWGYARDPERGWASDAGRVTVAVASGGAIVGAGLLSVLIGPTKLRVDTSKDAFLRRAGLGSVLEDTYLARFREKIWKYAPWVVLPLAVAGVPRVRGFTRRFLVAWAGLTIAGVPIGIWTGWFPPDRIITFGFALPVLAALGIAWAGEALETRTSRWLAWGVTAVLVGLLAWPALDAWDRQQPFISPEDLRAATEAGRIAATTPPGTSIVVIVNDIDDTAIFLATQAGNILRSALPPDRARDVYVYVGNPDRYFAGEPTLRGDPEYDTLSRQLLDDIPTGESAVFVLKEFDRVGGADGDPRFARWTPSVASTVPDPRPLPPGEGELTASTSWMIAGSTLLLAALLWVLGYGWARWTFGDPVTAAAVAPGFGGAALAIVGVACERIGLPLTGWWGPTLISLVAGGLGYGLLVRQGVPAAEPAA
jgi:hypothetical protein